jgi:4-carboxymuconolactone decarboxylase
MDTRDLNEKGLKLRREMFGDEAVDKRMKAFGAFGEPLQHIINAYAYGDVWSRPALPLATKSLAMVAMMAGAGRTNELRVHVKGALTNGCSAEQIQDILLLVAMYCGIAANEAIASRSMRCVTEANSWRWRCCASQRVRFQNRRTSSRGGVRNRASSIANNVK